MTGRTRYPRLARPPIVEGLINFEALGQDALPADTFSMSPEDLLGPGATRTPIRAFRADPFVRQDDQSQAGMVTNRIGYRYQNTDGTRVVQFRTDGMTYSIVNAYTTWENLERDALNALRIYWQRAGQAVSVRPAARFINRIVVPIDEPLDWRLQALPPVPSGHSFGIASFHAETQFGTRDGLTASLTLAADELLEESDAAAIILDVSVQSGKAFAVGSEAHEPDSALLAELGRIRNAKNAVFFGSLTTRALSAYQDPEQP